SWTPIWPAPSSKHGGLCWTEIHRRNWSPRKAPPSVSCTKRRRRNPTARPVPPSMSFSEPPLRTMPISHRLLLSLACLALLLPAACRRPDAPDRTGTSAGADALFPVRQNGRWGYIDATGEIVIAPQFESARRFTDGLALV